MLRRPPTTITLTTTDIQSYSTRRAQHQAQLLQAQAPTKPSIFSQPRARAPAQPPTTKTPFNSFAPSQSTQPHTPGAAPQTPSIPPETPTEPDDMNEDMDRDLDDDVPAAAPPGISSDEDETKENDSSAGSSDDGPDGEGVRRRAQREDSMQLDGVAEESGSEDDTFHAQTRQRTQRAQAQRARIVGRGGRGGTRNPSSALPRVERRGVGR